MLTYSSDGVAPVWRVQGRLAEQVQKEVQSLLQEALSVARQVVQRNLDLLHGLGAQLEGTVQYTYSTFTVLL